MLYDILLNILDRIRHEAPPEQASRYLPADADEEKINQARSRAYIHLYFKVLFGMLSFVDRERHITDGANDGGIDGYHIDQDAKAIYLVQSKFRTNEKNFQTKQVTLEEILKMDINRILEGEDRDEDGNFYNGKIKQLQREISQLPDVARYSYHVVFLANLKDISSTKLRQLTGGFSVRIIDFEDSYSILVFPVICGTYFTASDIKIPIDLSNKNAGSKISYTVKTKISECEITVLFAPTIEIAKIMSKYKNSILRYNPRSYLEFEGQSVNQAIRSTILTTVTNEFALYNNGITILSDETNINEKIGQKNKAQLHIKNPQIINGGQTSYTLSRIFDEHHNDAEAVFAEKEVLLKIITLIGTTKHEDKLRLIEEISNATNKQTPVINADRFANEVVHQELQKKIYATYAVLYERKRGEFSDGLRSGYITARSVVERNLFWRLFYSANGQITKGFQKRLFQKNEFDDFDIENEEALDRWYLGYQVFRQLIKDRDPTAPIGREIYGKVYAYIQMFLSQGLHTSDAAMAANLDVLTARWVVFLSDKPKRQRLVTYIDPATGEGKTAVEISEQKYLNSGAFEGHLVKFFGA